MLFSFIGVGNDNKIKLDLVIPSSIFVVAENVLFLITSWKISSYPGSSSKGKLSSLIFWTRDSLMSTPIVVRPDFAKDKALGRPILPIPTTQTRMVCDFNDFSTSS